MNKLVKILTSDDGEPRAKEEQNWHLITSYLGDPRTLCEGEFFGFGGSGCEYETKQAGRGGITCPKCLTLIKQIKSVKL